MPSNKSRTSLAAVLGLALALGTAGPTLAQERQFQAEKLQSFAVAALQVQQINMAVQQNMGQAGTQEEQQKVQAEGTQQMVQAIQAEGLTVEEYNEIATAAQSDPELATEIQQYIGTDTGTGTSAPAE